MKPGITWNKAKRYLEDDTRFKNPLLSKIDKEKLFDKYITAKDQEERQKKKYENFHTFIHNSILELITTKKNVKKKL
jgi:hypothetical protein